jgi:hypothetical protein
LKPVFYGIIGISVALVVTLIFLSYYIEQNRLSEVNEDLDTFTYYQVSMNNLLMDDCHSTPSLPESFKDLQNLVNEKEAELSKEAWKIENGISEPIKEEYSLEDYKTKMNQIMIKYRDTKYDVLFTYDVYQCENPDYLSFGKLKQSVQDYNADLSNKNNPSKYKQWDDRHADNYNVRLFWDLDECVVNFNEKNLGEKYGFELCIERLQPKVEFFCSRYSQEDCIETTNHELSGWLNGRYPNGAHPLNSWNLPK